MKNYNLDDPFEATIGYPTSSISPFGRLATRNASNRFFFLPSGGAEPGDFASRIVYHPFLEHAAFVEVFLRVWPQFSKRYLAR